MNTTAPQDDLFVRVLEFWEKKRPGYGWDTAYILYQHALSKSHKWTNQELSDYFYNVIWQKLYQHRVYTSKELDNSSEFDLLYDYYYDYYTTWLKLSKLDQCQIFNLDQLDRYPTHNVRTTWTSAAGFPLYQMPPRIKEIEEQHSISNWGYNFVASHTCHTKQCLVCTIKEPRSANTHRNYCVAFILIDNNIIYTCQHYPKCKDFGPNAFVEDINNNKDS
jgi:hypothetical protein